MKLTRTALSTMILLSGSAILQVTATRGATQISSGQAHTCAIDDKGNLQCWGSNAFGQLGDSTTSINRNKPTIISLGKGGKYATQIAVGDTHSCAIDNNNNLKCWGKDFYSKPGSASDDYYNRRTPFLISLDDYYQAYATQIVVGSKHSCIIDNSSFVRCWRSNIYGQLGDGKQNELSYSPQTTIDGIYATCDHSCAIDIYINIKCWGKNNHGQFGDGS